MYQETLNQSYATIQATAEYQRMGPVANPAELAPFTLETQAATILSQGTEANPIQWLARQARSEKLTQNVSADEALWSASMLADSLYSLDPKTASPGQKAMLYFGIQNSLLKPKNSSSNRPDQAEAAVRNFDVLNWFQRNNEPIGDVAGQDTRAIKLIDKILALRIGNTGKPFGDGDLLEQAISTMLHYKLWQQEIDGPDVYARLATRREDRPARGMPPQQGTRVAHDVVMQLGDNTVRIQAKHGEETHELDQDKYDKSIITIVTESAGGPALENILFQVKQAYRGDAKAAEFVDNKLKEYKLLEKITAYQVPKAAGNIALGGATS